MSASRARRRRARWRRRPNFFAFGGCACCTMPGGLSQYYYQAGRRAMVLVATIKILSGTTLAARTLYALDGASGALLWTADAGQDAGGGDKVVYGITRDDSGNFYCAYVGQTGVGTGSANTPTSVGIQKYSQDGALLQDWQPVGWMLSSWRRDIIGNGNSGGDLTSQCLFYSNGMLYWQHPGRQNGGTNKYDCISVLDLNFNELATYGASNFSAGWNSAATTPSCPGKVMCDASGNIFNEFQVAAGILNSSLIKLSPAGALLFSHQTVKPIQSGGWGYAIGQNGINDGHFDIIPGLGIGGMLGLLTCPDFSTDASGDAMSIDHSAGGIQVGWCTGVTDQCNDSNFVTRTINKQTLMLALNAGTLVNTLGGNTPAAQKSYCDMTVATGDRIAKNSTSEPCQSMCAGGGSWYVAFYPQTLRWVSYKAGVNHCITQPASSFDWTNAALWNSRESYGLGVFDGGTWTTTTLRNMTSIDNGFFGTSSDPQQGVQGLKYLAPLHFVVGVLSYFVDLNSQHTSKSPVFQVRAFSAANLNDAWTFQPQAVGTGNQPTPTGVYADGH